MKSGMPWNIRNLDPEAREAALEAAQRAGMPVTDWLNQAVARRAAEEGIAAAPPEDDEADDELRSVTQSVAELTRRIRAMDTNSRAAISGLKDRLDEIEQSLGRAGAPRRRDDERTPSLKGVSAMVDRLARDIDNADETARSQIEGQRRRAAAERAAPADVNEAIRLLDQRIAGIADRIKAPPPATEQEATLDDLRRRLDALLARGPQAEAAVPGAIALESTLKSLEGRIEEARARLNATTAMPEVPPEEGERMRRIEARLADISGRLDQPPPETPPDELTSAIAEIVARQRALEGTDAAALGREQKKMADSLATLRTDIAALAARLDEISRDGAEGNGAYFALARRIEALAAETPVDRSLLTGIRSEIDALRAISEGAARESTVTERLDEITRRAPDRSRLDALGEEVSAIRRALETSDSPKAINRLEMRLSELGRSLEAALSARQAVVETSAASVAVELADLRNAIEQLGATGLRAGEGHGATLSSMSAGLDEIRRALIMIADASKRNDPARAEKAIARLEGRFDDVAARIDGVIARTAPVEMISGLHDRLEALADRLDAVSLRTVDPQAIDEIKREISEIRAEIASRQPPRTDHLERQIRDLAARLETASRPEANTRQLDELEAQVERLAGELQQAMPRGAALRQVEENLVRLQAHLSENRAESVEAARVAARDAVRELSSGQPDMALVEDLRRDLDHIRTLAGDTGQQANEKLHSLESTLETIVERLARIETETEQAEAAPSAEPAAPRVELPAAGTRVQKVMEALENRPLEPGSRRPDLAALRELAANSSERAPAERRADFIAAARRAAQAAVAEAAGSSEPGRPPEPRQSPFARIGQAIRARKKPLLLAAAAIVLAIGSLYVYGPELSTRSTDTVLSKAPPAPKAAVVAAAPVKPAPVIVAATPVAPVVNKPLAAPAPDTKPVMMASAAPAPREVAPEPSAVAVSQFGANPFAPPVGQFSKPADDAADAAEPVPARPAAAAVQAKPGPRPLPTPAIDPKPQPVPAVASAPEAKPLPTPASVTVGADPAGAPGVAAIGSDKLRAAAEAGNPAAAFEIATRYAEGRGVDQNLATAAEWYKRAAEGGVAVAQYRLGSLYERGQGVKKDLTQSVNWYQRAADQGNVGAMHNLAVLMSEGADGPPDPAKALQWFLAAANYGVKDSQYNLGVIYARGLGAAPDMAESYKWFAIAAAQGDKDAAGRRDEVAGVLNKDQLAKARAAVSAWRAKPPIAEANVVAAPAGGWDGDGDGITAENRQELVKKIQALLSDQGYDVGNPDGIEGPKTRDAVRAFQRSIGATETGQIDTKLAAALADRQG